MQDDRRLIVFRSRLMPGVEQAYAPRAAQMYELAQRMPGFVSATDFTAEDGERVSIIEFESGETLRAWREHAEHQRAQAEGRERWYQEYTLSVCRVLRESRFANGDPPKRPGPAATPAPAPDVDLAGGCACGAIRYRVRGKPRLQTLCHCSDCRKACGATPVAWATFDRTAFELERGTLTERASSERARRGFCAGCGCQITFQYVAHPSFFDLTIASLDDPSAIPPRSHIYLRSKPEWLKLGDELPRYEGPLPNDPS